MNQLNKSDNILINSISLKGLFRITFPLMISGMSSNIMLFMDRLILSEYSLKSMNAASNAFLGSAIFSFAFIAIASISEVYASEYNGENNFKKVSQPIWQMIIFSFMSSIVFIPVSLYCSELFISEAFHKEGCDYFKLIMLFGPLGPLLAALYAFFISIGRSSVISYNTIFCNVLNIILDVIFIFGFLGIKPMGAYGAALATIISKSLEVIIAFSIFLSKEYRVKYATSNICFRYDIFKDCLKLGLPGSISHVLEILVWLILFNVASSSGVLYVSILSVGQSILILFAFLTEGLQKGIISISSNLIGARRFSKIRELLYSAFKLQLIVTVIITVIIIFSKNYILESFFDTVKDNTVKSLLLSELNITIIYIVLYIFIDGLVWIVAGILTSYKDTKYVMIVNISCSWILGLLPNYFLITYFKVNPSFIWFTTILYATSNLIIFYKRYLTNSAKIPK